ncbi:MAG: hypothetical protein GWP11_01015 [Proteobacteria bacterium]|nr:hypothetical protein [Pseudomonadota bacterium]
MNRKRTEKRKLIPGKRIKQEENNMNEICPAAVKVRTKSAEKVNVEMEVNKAAIATIGIAAGIVGAWVLSAFVGGVIASGGILPLIMNWFHAVMG